jgi:hypothetical protein
MRLFHLLRLIDVTGISGTGRIAEGVQFTGGQCVLHWLTGVSSIAVYNSTDDLLHIHGHGGDTLLVWEDES